MASSSDGLAAVGRDDLHEVERLDAFFGLHDIGAVGLQERRRSDEFGPTCRDPDVQAPFELGPRVFVFIGSWGEVGDVNPPTLGHLGKLIHEFAHPVGAADAFVEVGLILRHPQLNVNRVGGGLALGTSASDEPARAFARHDLRFGHLFPVAW